METKFEEWWKEQEHMFVGHPNKDLVFAIAMNAWLLGMVEERESE